MTSTTTFLTRLPSPIGRVEITSDGASVDSLSIERDGALPHDHLPENPNPVLDEAARQLSEYFAGTRTEFDLPVVLNGTEFQSEVWSALRRVGFGELTSYGELGRATGRASAGRAIGGAIGANPVPIIVGCHRVLASNGRITGYSAGEGIPTKVWLLDHEGIGHR